MLLSAEYMVQILARMGKEVNSSLDWTETATRFAQLVTPEICDYCGVWIVDHTGHLKSQAIMTSQVWPQDTKFVFRPGFGPEICFKTQGLEFVSQWNQAHTDVFFEPISPAGLHEIGSYMCIPLKGSQGVLGAAIFILHKSRKSFTRSDLEVMKQLCESVSVSLDRAQLFEDLKSSQSGYAISEKRANKANQAKSEFLASMSHEIRTPLSAIIGFADMILSESMLENNDIRDWTYRIKCNGLHLMKVVNEILDISKIEAGSFELEFAEVDIQKLIYELLAALEPQAKKNGNRIVFNLESAIPTSIYTDYTRLMQVLINLIGNAIKFTDHGLIRIKISFDVTSQDLNFVIEDNGIGLTSEQSERLFQPFKQADLTHSKRFGGTGLGLSLSRKLARYLGGDVKLMWSKPQTGSAFLVHVKHQGESVKEYIQKLSYCPPQSLFEYHEQTDGKLLAGRRLLLAEDSTDYQRLISLFLARTGLKIDFASTGAEALEAAQNQNYDYLLLDIQMPELCGFDVCHKLRLQGYNGKIFALSASARKEDYDHAMDVGFDDYISKPIDRKRLTELLKNASPLLKH